MENIEGKERERTQVMKKDTVEMKVEKKKTEKTHSRETGMEEQ